MQRVLAIMGILSLLGLGTSTAQQSETAAPGQLCVLRVSGMHCGQCAQTVEKAAKKIDGVISVKASQPKNSADVTYDPAKTSPEAIAKAISANTPFKAEAPKKSEQQ